ncbi:ABC transporter ATP-binding protein [Biostraticola tofi]|uniref:Peptide/nickel transport system ATP-binding protein n=1 Tax=Biostraticola tofi TaxID=466109 RepID=A0A4R3Z3R2_9GAMM|nr:oligopeptide/dipeptide ABC transporter ATP-binding protein [Biostraticola tofi]TCV98943.1 peptide/nickel transport system ATP-binding protein [Biostraticola tofi]
MNNTPLIEVNHLKHDFPIKDGLFGQTTGQVYAVDDVSFSIPAGSIFGLVGESGSGKTTVGRALLGLYSITEGSVRYRGRELVGLSRKQWHELRPKLQLVFQDPYSSLNPRIRVGDAIGEALLEHKLATPDTLRQRVTAIMQTCGLSASDYDRFPHQFSGGQRQRIGIARALILQPDFIVADEPISALDVSIQAQIINLFADLRDNFGVTFLFISHDLGVVEHLCDEVAVMYLGQIVERASRDVLFAGPRHPYTQALLAAVPTLAGGVPPLSTLARGEPANPAEPPSGCRFHPRCPKADSRCQREAPQLRAVGSDIFVRCHYA